MTASHPACMATSAEVSGPQPQGPQTEWADAETSSLVWSDPNTSTAHAMGSTMISPILNTIIAVFRNKSW